jgi:hypothetical protein
LESLSALPSPLRWQSLSRSQLAWLWVFLSLMGYL